jgi:hypothetical protein
MLERYQESCFAAAPTVVSADRVQVTLHSSNLEAQRSTSGQQGQNPDFHGMSVLPPIFAV